MPRWWLHATWHFDISSNEQFHFWCHSYGCSLVFVSYLGYCAQISSEHLTLETSIWDACVFGWDNKSCKGSIPIDIIRPIVESTEPTWQWQIVLYCTPVAGNGIINPLRAKFFRGNMKHIFTFYIIPPYWYDRDCWNSYSNKTKTYPF